MDGPQQIRRVLNVADGQLFVQCFGVEFAGFGLLRRHVADRAENAAFLGFGSHGTGELGVAGIVKIGELGQAKIEQLDLAVVGDHDVARLEIAMNDSGRVRPRETVGNGYGVLE